MRRMTHTPPPLTKDLIEAFAASAVAWLVRLLGVVLDPSAPRRRRRLIAFVRHIERCVECIIFLKAVHAFGLAPRRRSRQPRSIPTGFRCTKGNPRLLWKSARIRARGASLVDRVVRLLEALTDWGVYVARFMKRLINGLCFGRLVPSAPPGVALAATAPTALAFTDSS
jgi:hypothetical protein